MQGCAAFLIATDCVRVPERSPVAARLRSRDGILMDRARVPHG